VYTENCQWAHSGSNWIQSKTVHPSSIMSILILSFNLYLFLLIFFRFPHLLYTDHLPHTRTVHSIVIFLSFFLSLITECYKLPSLGYVNLRHIFQVHLFLKLTEISSLRVLSLKWKTSSNTEISEWPHCEWFTSLIGFLLTDIACSQTLLKSC